MIVAPSNVLYYHQLCAFQQRWLNRTQGKSVSLKKLARAFALERQQSPVSYVGIDIVSRTILKIMYRTISKSTFDDESRWNTTTFRSGTGSNLPAAQEKTCTLQLTPASNRMPIMRRVSNRWTQAENPGENHWTIGRYDFNLVRQISYFYEILARTYDRSYDRS